jgi:Holliday junction DNA helicase RuvB
MFDKFIGQENIKKELIAIQRAMLNERENENVNILLRGPAGCGKTYLARTFCEPFGYYKYTIAKKVFIVNEEEALLFPRVQILDEIHNMKDFEYLFQFLDSPRFSFIMCTTDFGVLPDALTSRCIQLTFSPYNEEEITAITLMYGREIGLTINEETASLISARSRGSPRVAKNLTMRIKFIIDQGYYTMSLHGVKSAFNDIGVFHGGYTELDIRYLKTLQVSKNSSLSSLSRRLGIDEETIKNVIEPFLLDKNHIKISSKGRQFLSWQEGETND